MPTTGSNSLKQWFHDPAVTENWIFFWKNIQWQKKLFNLFM